MRRIDTLRTITILTNDSNSPNRAKGTGKRNNQSSYAITITDVHTLSSNVI